MKSIKYAVIITLLAAIFPISALAEITTLIPADNADRVSLNEQLTLRFVEEMEINEGSIVIKDSSDDSVFETIDVESDQVSGSGTKSIRINPDFDFFADTEYYVEIDAGAFEGPSGEFEGISDHEEWNFETESVDTAEEDDVVKPPTAEISSLTFRDGYVIISGKLNLDDDIQVTQTGFFYWTDDEDEKSHVIFDRVANSFTYNLKDMACDDYTFEIFSRNSSFVSYSKEKSIEVTENCEENDSEDTDTVEDADEDSDEITLSPKMISLIQNNFNSTLKIGSMSGEVKTLQQVLNALGLGISGTGSGSAGHETEYFGQLTHDALVRFQNAFSLPATGVVSDMTQKYLKIVNALLFGL